MSYADEIKKILENHYEWCKKEGRDISWYKEYKEGKKDVCMETPKVLQRNKEK